MVRKKETITLSIPPGTKEELEAIARRLNIFWGKDPSISGLLVAIAQQKPEARKLFTLNRDQSDALLQATKIISDNGNILQAQTLLSLLLEQGELEVPLRQALEQLFKTPSDAWRTQVDEYINNQQPFHLLYRNAQEANLSYNVRYAQISFEEKRFYLEIWCEETEDLKNPDFPELIHNRCLRLDRIQGITPINRQWRKEGLDYLKVYLHFYRGLVKAYESKDNRDLSNEVIGEIRQVVRRVSNPFWLIREIFHYGEDCEIISPENVRQQFKRKLRSLCQRYDLDIRD